MAMSPAMQWALANGMSQADVYKNINDFLATNPNVAQTQAQMAQYGISPEDVAAATGGKSGGLLGGNILAGASWNSLNTTLGNQLTAATGKPSTNIAVGGATTADTLSQLNKFLSGGGQFDSNSTVYLQTGGVDFITGIDKNVVKSNISQIVKTLGSLGVNVVLTGSPYAKSLDDVINNNFDPKVDQIFTDIANENKNVALVGIQGEILKNKSLLVDALHTNAEGTAIYNQAVIDSLSQFKNNVPSSTPQAIAQVQQTNTVATTPPIITQASVSPVVAQSLAKAIPTTRGTVIEGDDIEAQIAGVPQVVYETRVDPNNTANWETFNPKTGEVIDRGTFAGGGDKGLLAAAAPVIGLAASTVGLPFITSLLGGATGLTGSALAGATGATIGAGTQAITGGSAEDIARAALLGGGGAYLGNVLSNLDVPVDFNNMTADELSDALQENLIKDLKQAGVKTPQEFLTGQGANAANFVQESVAASTVANNLSNQGLNSNQISQLLDSAGFTNTAITDALDTLAVVTPVAVSTPVTDTSAVNIVGQSATPTLNNVINTLASPVAVSTPVTDNGTVKVTGTTQPQMTTQQAVDLVNSQIAANVNAPTNLANVQVTAPKTQQDLINTLAATLPVGINTPVNTTTAPEIAKQTITAPKAVTTQEIVNATTATIPAVATTPVADPRVTITAQKPSTITDDVTAATIPLIQPTTTLTVPEVTAKQDLTTAEQLRLAQLALTAAGLLGAGSALTNTDTGTQFPIIPVPADWKSPPATGVAPFTPLPPIDFGTRELLRGTQWEKFLSPTYGKVPEPVMYSQPSKMSYSDLMGILGSKQGMPAKSSLSINDIISGIQNQYGQTPTRTMG